MLEYLPAVPAMQIILIALIPIGITQVLGVQILTPMEKEKYVLYSVIAGAGIDFLLNLALIPGYGAADAALATTIAEFLVLLFGAISFFGIYGFGLLIARGPLVLEFAEEIKNKILKKTN